MKYCLVLLILFCYANSAESQQTKHKKEIYFDEVDATINKRQHDIKLKSDLFSSVKFETDTLILHKLRFSHLFGTLDTIKKQQLFKLLSARNSIDTTKIIVIHYQDTLRRIDEFAEEDGIIQNKNGRGHRHVISHNTFINQHKKCLRNLYKKGVNNVYHFYKHNNGHPEVYESYTWERDHLTLIDRLFRDSFRRFGTIVIYPNGNFFCRNYSDDNLHILKDVTKGKKWDKHLKRFKKKLELLSSK